MSVEVVIVMTGISIAEVVVSAIVASLAIGGVAAAVGTAAAELAGGKGENQEIISSLEEKRKELEKERQRLESQEVLNKLSEFKTIEEFQKWYTTELIKYKSLEADVMRHVEMLKLELEERKKDLERRVSRIRSILSTCGVDVPLKHGMTTGELEDELKELVQLATSEAEKLRKSLIARIDKLPSGIKLQAQAYLENVMANVDDPVALFEISKKVTDHISEFENYAELLKSALKNSDLSKYKLDISRFREELENSNRASRCSQVREQILTYVELVKELDASLGEKLVSKFGKLEEINEEYFLKNILDEVKIIYGTLKTEITTSNAYRKLIKEMRNAYRDYPAIQNLASKVLSKERISDRDYKEFIEEMMKYIVRKSTDDYMKMQKKKIAEKLKESLAQRGYELIVSDEEEEVDVASALESGKVIEVLPKYSNEHFVKVKMKDDGQLVFKFFKSEDSKASLQDDLEFSRKWCQDFKEVVTELDEVAKTELALIVEPEEVKEFSKARSMAKKKILRGREVSKGQAQQRRSQEHQN